MYNFGGWIIDVTTLLLFLVPAVWFAREARRNGDRFQHGAAISFSVVAALVLTRIAQSPVL